MTPEQVKLHRSQGRKKKMGGGCGAKTRTATPDRPSSIEVGQMKLIYISTYSTGLFSCLAQSFQSDNTSVTVDVEFNLLQRHCWAEGGFEPLPQANRLLFGEYTYFPGNKRCVH